MCKRNAERSAQRTTYREQRSQGSSGSSTAQCHRPRQQLEQAQCQHGTQTQLAADDGGDVAVADAKRHRHHIAHAADHQSTQRGPPHPVDRQLCKTVLDGIRQPRDRHADDTEDEAEHDIGSDGRKTRRRNGGHRKHRLVAFEHITQRSAGHGGQGHRNQ
jgi:hypothetical protein